MKNILLIVAALGILGAIVAGCSQPAAEPAAGETAGAGGTTPPPAEPGADDH